MKKGPNITTTLIPPKNDMKDRIENAQQSKDFDKL